MTTRQMLTRVMAQYASDEGAFILQGTTTAAGTSTTLVDTGQSAKADDFFNEMELEVTSGSAAGERKDVLDWVKSTSTFTLESGVSAAIAGSVTYTVGAKGFWSVLEILDYLTDGVQLLKSKCVDEVFFKNLATSTKSGFSVAGRDIGESDLPTDMIRPVSIFIDGVKASKYEMQDAGSFEDDPFIGTAILISGGDIITAGRQAHFKPKGNATIKYNYIKESSVTFSSNSDLPAHLHKLLVDYACHRGWLKRRNLSLANNYMSLLSDKIESINLQALGKAGINQ